MTEETRFSNDKDGRDAFDAQRLHNIAKALGVETAVPEGKEILSCIGAVCGIYYRKITQANATIAELTKRLSWWETPHDAKQLEAIKEQASHADSLAAQTIYIGHLERYNKELTKQLAERDATIQKAMEQEPIDELEASLTVMRGNGKVEHYEAGTKVFAVPPIPAIPEDMVMVPREPTEEMITAAYDCECSGSLPHTYNEIYKAMLKAAEESDNNV